MNVVIPHAKPAWPLQAAQLALRQDGVEPELAQMTTDESYYELMVRIWSARQGVIIVEHDVVCWPGAIQELENCSQQWCTFPYYCSLGWIEDGLGCTKFSPEMMAQYPQFFAEPFPACCNHSTHYCGLDRFIAHRMQEIGLSPHVHKPGVSNLNERWT